MEMNVQVGNFPNCFRVYSFSCRTIFAIFKRSLFYQFFKIKTIRLIIILNTIKTDFLSKLFSQMADENCYSMTFCNAAFVELRCKQRANIN